MRIFLKAAAIAALTAAAAAPAALAQAPAAPKTVMLKTGAGADAGWVSAVAAPTGVLLKIDLKGLAPGWHGMHLHAKGDCSDPKFTTAGGHINHPTTARKHGLLNPEGPDFGDLPNIYVAADGTARAEAFTTLVKIADLTDADGSAVVVHANADDHLAQPIGGAGDRVACGVVK